jgi:hypothetical protein
MVGYNNFGFKQCIFLSILCIGVSSCRLYDRNYGTLLGLYKKNKVQRCDSLLRVAAQRLLPDRVLKEKSEYGISFYQLSSDSSIEYFVTLLPGCLSTELVKTNSLRDTVLNLNDIHTIYFKDNFRKRYTFSPYEFNTDTTVIDHKKSQRLIFRGSYRMYKYEYFIRINNRHASFLGGSQPMGLTAFEIEPRLVEGLKTIYLNRKINKYLLKRSSR